MDPFTILYDEIVRFLKESPGIKSVLGENNVTVNVVNLNAGHGQDQFKETLNESALPEIDVAHMGIAGNFNIASNCAMFIRSIRLGYQAGTGKIGETIFPLEFAIACAATSMNFADSFRQLAWHGHRFIKDIIVQPAASGEVDPERSRGILGWAGQWDIDFHCTLSQLAMKQFNDGETITDPAIV